MFTFYLLTVCVSYCLIFLRRASQRGAAENVTNSQVLQYELAHQGSINTVTNLSPDLSVSGGSDQVTERVARYYKIRATNILPSRCGVVTM